MFKKVTAFVLSLIFGLSVGASVPVNIALAQDGADGVASRQPNGGSQNARDPNTLRVYYSESIGAGEQVYHLTWCEKAPAYGPLTCSDELITVDPNYGTVCTDSKTNKAIEGQQVKGCLKEQKNGGETTAGKITYKINDTDVELPYYNITPPADRACLEKHENQEPIYGRKYAVVEYDMVNTPDFDAAENDPNNIVGSVSWPDDADAELAKTYATRIFEPGETTELIVKPAYEIAQCASVDLLIDSSGNANGEPQGPDAAVARFKDYKSQFDTLIAGGCNNDNTSASVGQERSTTFNNKPVLTCTLSERINGKSGTDLLARYVGAIYRWAAGVIGIISVLVIVISGVQITVDTSGLEKAKERIQQSLMGLVLLFLSALILYTINPTFFTG